MSRMKPMAEETFSSVPVRSSMRSAPPKDRGAAARMRTAGVKERNSTTRMTRTSEAAMARTVRSWRNAPCCDSYCPPTSTL
jgi:hypothetical protein